MKFNRKICLFLFIVFVSFIGIIEVKAKDTVASCTYTVKNKTIGGEKYENLTLRYILYDDNSHSMGCDSDVDKSSTAWYKNLFGDGCSIGNKDTASLFVAERTNGTGGSFGGGTITSDPVLYCPEKVYLNLDHDTGAHINVSFATKKSSNDGFLLENGVDGTNLELGGLAGTYTPESSNGILKACKTGGRTQAQTISNKLNNYESTINNYGTNINSQAANSMLEILEKFKVNNSVDEYCYTSNADYESKITDLVNILSEKVTKSTSMTEEEKESFQQRADVTRSTLGDAPRYNSRATYTCTELLDQELVSVIKLVLKWVRILVPILLIILVTIDLSQAVISQDQDAIKKATSKIVKRAIAALAVFFIPFLVSLMLDWAGDAVKGQDGELYFNRERADCTEVIK